MSDLTGKVAVVTGGANGMGEAVVHTLAARGARVVIADKDAERSALVEGEVRAKGGEVQAIPTDVSDEEQVKALVAQTVDVYGRIDVLDNNAAALDLTATDSSVLELEASVFEGTLRTNLIGPFLCSKYVIPEMFKVGGGSIVNMASISGMAGEVELTAYGASKAGLIQLTRATAVQYSRQNVRCNAIAPAYVLTRNNAQFAPPELAETYARNVLTPELATPQDIAEVVAFLASDKSRLVTGHVIPVDGGIMAASPIVADRRAAKAAVPV